MNGIELHYHGMTALLVQSPTLGARIIHYGDWLTPGTVAFTAPKEDHKAFQELLTEMGIGFRVTQAYKHYL